MNCRKIQANLANLLFEPETVTAEVRSHVEDCADCARELRELQATMQAMDAWTAPEPSPYFDARMQVLLREEKQAEPMGFWGRLRSRLVFGSNLQMRPIAAGALALLIAVGGGTYATYYVTGTPAPQPSATVRDLQTLDGNEEVFQQLSYLDQPDMDQSDDDPGSQSNDL